MMMARMSFKEEIAIDVNFSDSIEQSSSIFEESTQYLSTSIEESPQDIGKDIWMGTYSSPTPHTLP